MKIKFVNGVKSFTLIEIIVVLVILGVLTAIALPNFFSWIKKAQAGEAILTLSTIKNDVEACLDTHIGFEANCSSSTLPYDTSSGSANFYYGWLTYPQNTQPNPGSNISACVVAILAAPINPPPGFVLNFPGEDTAYAFPYNPNSIIEISRDSNGNWSCTGNGFWAGIC